MDIIVRLIGAGPLDGGCASPRAAAAHAGRDGSAAGHRTRDGGAHVKSFEALGLINLERGVIPIRDRQRLAEMHEE